MATLIRAHKEVRQHPGSLGARSLVELVAPLSYFAVDRILRVPIRIPSAIDEGIDTVSRFLREDTPHAGAAFLRFD